MLPDDAPAQAPTLARQAEPLPQTGWIAGSISRRSCRAFQTERQPEPAMTSPAPEPKSSGIPHFVVILAFFAFLLIFATIEIMLRNNERQK